MTSVLLEPRCDGLDAASFCKITNYQPVAAAGYKWISFYLGGTYGVTSRQIDGAWTAGLPIMLNYERAANAGLGGTTVGVTAATTAMNQAKQLGFLGEAPIVFSGVDFGPSVAQFPALDGYHHGIVDVFTAAGWVGGAYGPRAYLQHLVAQEWWPGTWPLWHWGGDGYTVYDWAWAKQWYGKKPTAMGDARDNSGIGYGIDENTLLKPMAFWSGYGPDAPPPPPQPAARLPQLFSSEDELGTYRISYGTIPGLADGGVYETLAGMRRHVTEDEWFQVLKGVSQNRDGSWPVRFPGEMLVAGDTRPLASPWTPLAAIANGWNLAGMPVYTAPVGEPGPPGPPGAKGADGPPGQPGEDGKLVPGDYPATLHVDE